MASIVQHETDTDKVKIDVYFGVGGVTPERAREVAAQITAAAEEAEKAAKTKAAKKVDAIFTTAPIGAVFRDTVSGNLYQFTGMEDGKTILWSLSESDGRALYAGADYYARVNGAKFERVKSGTGHPLQPSGGSRAGRATPPPF